MKKAVSGILVVLLFGTACYNNYQVAGTELYKLSGYREGQTVRLATNEGDTIPFNGKSTLALHAVDGQEMKAKFSAITVDGNTMTGVMRGSGAPVNVDLTQISSAEIRNFATGKTVGLAVGLGVGIPVVIVVAVVVAAFATAAAASSSSNR